MKKITYGIVWAFCLGMTVMACNSDVQGDKTGDSATAAPDMDNTRMKDTSSYERMPQMTGDSAGQHQH